MIKYTLFKPRMNILMFYKKKPSLDPIIYPYLKKYARVFLLSKDQGDFLINQDDTVDEKALEHFIKKNAITHFLYVENSSYIPIFLNELPHHVKKVMLLIDTHINKKRRLPYFSLFNLILLVNKHQIQELKKYNPNITWLTYGGDTKTFYKLSNVTKKHNVFFNGNIVPWIHYHRFVLLAYLKMRSVNFFYSSLPYPYHNKLFNQSKIVLNRSPLGGWNLRIFEALSSGAFLLTDRPKNGMEKIFLDKKHLVYYDSFSDLKNKIDYYLIHDKERETIAKKGYTFVRKYYSWDEQIKKMLTILQSHTYKPFKRKPYHLSLSNLQCFSFRNKTLALRCLEASYKNNEINYFHYFSLRLQYNIYLAATSGIIKILNNIRVYLLTKPFEKKATI